MSEHPQQIDRTLRDTRILTLRIWGVVGCIVIAAVIFNLMGILAPVIEFLAVGSIIAFVMSPITNWLEHHGVGRGLGSLIALIVVVAVLVGVVCILSPILLGQIMEVLSRLPEQLRVAGGDLNEMLSHAKTLNNTPLKEYLDDNLSSLVTVASKYVSQIAAELGRGVFPLITNTASQLFVIFLGLVLAYWLACDYPRMHHEVCTIIGQEKETSYRFMVAILSRSVGGYMRGMVVTSICGGFLAFIGFTLIGHPYAALMAIFTGIMHLVPVVGPWVSAAIATVLGFMFSPMLALWTLVVTMVDQHVTDNVTQRFFRNQRIDIRIIFRGELVQNHTTNRCFDHMPDRLTVLVHVINLHLDFSMQVYGSLVESDNHFLWRIELQSFTLHALSRFRDIVQTEYHILRRHSDRRTVSRVQNVMRTQH